MKTLRPLWLFAACTLVGPVSAHAQAVYCRVPTGGDVGGTVAIMSAQDCTNYSAPRPSYQGGVFRAENLGRVLTQDALHNEFAELLNRMQAIIDTFNTRATAAVGQAHTARDSVTALRNDIVARLERLPSEVLTAEVVADLRTQVRAELQSAVAEEVRRQLAARATNP